MNFDVTREVEVEVEVNCTEVTCECGASLEFECREEKYDTEFYVNVEPHDCKLAPSKNTVECMLCGAPVNFALGVSGNASYTTIEKHDCKGAK